MFGAAVLIGILVLPVIGWRLLRARLMRSNAGEPPSELPIVYVHWSILVLFGLFGALNAWSGMQLLALVYLVVLAAPGALVATLVWRKKRHQSRGERLTWWMTAAFAPAVAVVLGALYLTVR